MATQKDMESLPTKKLPFKDKWIQRAKRLRSETYALYLAFKDKRTPWYARVFAGLVVAYAFSPIDLIPDFIPILGYLDDLLLIPLGISLALKMIPAEVMDESRLRAEAELKTGKPVNWVAAVIIILVWLAILALVVTWLVGKFKKGG
jgi:uncharacterized membrane protein YkvA (DUF1232 family)